MFSLFSYLHDFWKNFDKILGDAIIYTLAYSTGLKIQRKPLKLKYSPISVIFWYINNGFHVCHTYYCISFDVPEYRAYVHFYTFKCPHIWIDRKRFLTFLVYKGYTTSVFLGRPASIHILIVGKYKGTVEIDNDFINQSCILYSCTYYCTWLKLEHGGTIKHFFKQNMHWYNIYTSYCYQTIYFH